MVSSIPLGHMELIECFGFEVLGKGSLTSSWNFPLCPMVTSTYLWEVVVSSIPLGHTELIESFGFEVWEKGRFQGAEILLFVLWLHVRGGGFVHSIGAHGVNLIFWFWSVGERSLPGSWNFPLCPMVTWEVVVVSSTPLGHMELNNRTSSVGYVFILDWICSTVHGLYYWSMWSVLTWSPSKIVKPPSRKILSF